MKNHQLWNKYQGQKCCVICSCSISRTLNSTALLCTWHLQYGLCPERINAWSWKIFTTSHPRSNFSTITEAGIAADCCSWNAAITCGSNKQITALNLRGCGIKGQIGNLLSIPTLVNVSLDSNELYGKLPADLTRSMALHTLTAYGNKLSGDLCALAPLTSLITLDLHFNELTGLLLS